MRRIPQLVGWLMCRLGLHKWFTMRVGSDVSVWGEPSVWGTTSCLRPGCGRSFQWAGDE